MCKNEALVKFDTRENILLYSISDAYIL